MPERILQKAKEAALTDLERAEGLALLQSFVTTYPMEAAAPSEVAPPSPALKPQSQPSGISGVQSFSVPSPFVFDVRAFLASGDLKRLVPVILAVAVFLVGGTSYAASRSLPGDILYPFKIHVNEAAESLSAIGAGASARVEAEHATNRLDEAEQLASEGRLDPVTQTQLESSFQDNASLAVSYSEDLRQEGDAEGADRVRSDFQAALSARELSIRAVAAASSSSSPDMLFASSTNGIAVVAASSTPGTSLDRILGAVSRYLAAAEKEKNATRVATARASGYSLDATSSEPRHWHHRPAVEQAEVQVANATSGTSTVMSAVSAVMSVPSSTDSVRGTAEARSSSTHAVNVNDMYREVIEKSINATNATYVSGTTSESWHEIQAGANATVSGAPSASESIRPAQALEIIQPVGSRLGI